MEAGAGLTAGSLNFAAPTALVETRLDAVPTVALGLEAWPAAEIGLHLALAIGTGATLSLPGRDDELDYNVHQLRAGGAWRWSPASGGDGWDVRLGLGLHGVVQRVQAQDPALLVDSQVAGPALDLDVDKHLLSRRVRLTAGAGLEVPFFVRESPRDSGDPGVFYAWSLHGEARWMFQRTLGLAFEVRFTDRTVEFDGEGTRAGGTVDGRTHDRFASSLLKVRYLP